MKHDVVAYADRSVTVLRGEDPEANHELIVEVARDTGGAARVVGTHGERDELHLRYPGTTTFLRVH